MAIVKVEKNNYTVESLHQWDLNQTLEIYGLSMAKTPEVHFTNDLMVAAVRRYATMDAAGVIRAEIPNALLQKAITIKAMVCIREGEIFKTYHTIRIPVKPRQMPADYTITDDQDVYSFLALEDLVADSVAGMKAENAALQKNLTAQYESVAQPVASAVAQAQAAATQATQAAEVAQGVDAKATEALAKATEALETPPATYYTATLPASGWAGVEAPYTQEVAVAGILATDKPHITPVYSATLTTALAQKEAWAAVCAAEATAGKVTFTCFEEKPGVSINIQIEVVR